MLYLQSIIVYTLLTLLMCYGAYRSQCPDKQSLLWEWLPIILYTLVFGLRYGVGVDYWNYLETYSYSSNFKTLSDFVDKIRFENGFVFLIYLCHAINAPSYIFFALVAFIQISLIYNTFKKEGDVLLYIYLTLILTGICVYMFMNVLRHTIAFCIFLYSLQYIRDNKLLKYWTCCICAMLFHHSAIILFPLYFIWLKNKSLFNRPKIEFVILILCFIGSFVTSWQELLHRFDGIIILLGYENYIETADAMTINATFGIGKIISLLLNIIIILNSKKIKEYFHSDLLNILYDLYFIGVCLSYLFLTSMLIGRIILYFDLTRFILIAYALRYFNNTRKENIHHAIKYIVCIFCILTSFVAFISNCEKNTGAYVTYFQKELHNIKDYQHEIMFD